VKWERWSGLVLLLPHGYEGAGPEHSSARMERFLQLCGNNNMQVVYPSTAAQVFHMFRRQVRRPFRKPLIVMTPKSMLRPPTSTIDELTAGHFQDVLDDAMFTANPGGDRGAVKRVLLCSGKICHELSQRRADLARKDTAIIRMEQLYPFNADLLAEVLGRYPAPERYIWVQEEPRNAGAYLYMDDVLRNDARFGVGLDYIGRPASASPAVGSKHRHKDQQEKILSDAIGPLAPAKQAAPGAPPLPAANGSNGRHRQPEEPAPPKTKKPARR
jgi:2-oxoglutarate dehydrogenase E1 component